MFEFTKNLTDTMDKFTKDALSKCKKNLFKGNYAVVNNRHRIENDIQKIYAICVLNTGEMAFIWITNSSYPELVLGITEIPKRWKIKAKRVMSISLNNIDDNTKFQTIVHQLIDKFNNDPDILYYVTSWYQSRFIISTEYLIDKNTKIFHLVDSSDNTL